MVRVEVLCLVVDKDESPEVPSINEYLDLLIQIPIVSSVEAIVVIVGKPTAGILYIPVFQIRMEKMKEVKRPPL
ncbi:hypothetical protein BHE74_00038858 [Ensete ventricosum]|nr:hypothetical protein BHE74_00038858 [Ensete ventricosum]